MGGTLGDLEQVVLFALVKLKGEAPGAAIIGAIEIHTGRVVAPGALYTVCDRLETKGLIESRLGEGTPARGGRRKKIYAIVPAGAAALDQWFSGIRELAAGTAARLARMAEGEG